MIVHSFKNPIIFNKDMKQYTPKPKLTEEEKIERDKIGKQIQNYRVSNLKRYVSNSNFKNKYKNNITPKSIFIEKTDEYLPFGLGDTAAYEIRVSYYDYGIDEEYLNKWKKMNLNKDIEDCPICDNDWYYELLDKGEELVKEADKKFNNKYKLEYESGHNGNPTIDFYIYQKI